MTRMIGVITVLFVLILTVFSPPSLASAPDSTAAIPSLDRSDTSLISVSDEFSPDVVVKEQVTQYCYPSSVPCNLWVTTSRTRGMVNLSWSYTGPTYRRGYRLYLVVERSTNRTTWSSVYTCRQAASSYYTSYYCSDTGLRSGRTYYYRVCATTSSRCGTTYVSPWRSVRVL